MKLKDFLYEKYYIKIKNNINNNGNEKMYIVLKLNIL